jgi:hypothetical protein
MAGGGRCLGGSDEGGPQWPTWAAGSVCTVTGGAAQLAALVDGLPQPLQQAEEVGGAQQGGSTSSGAAWSPGILIINWCA